MSPRRRPMTSSVSVVRAWERHVSHTSSPIFTEDSDISAAAGRLWFRAAVDWLVRGVSSGLFWGTAASCVASLAWLVRRVSLRGWTQNTLSSVGSWVQCGWTGRRHCRWSQDQEFGWGKESFLPSFAEVFSFTLKSDKLYLYQISKPFMLPLCLFFSNKKMVNTSQ